MSIANNRRLRPLLSAPASLNRSGPSQGHGICAPPPLLRTGAVPGGPSNGIAIHQERLMNSAAQTHNQDSLTIRPILPGTLPADCEAGQSQVHGIGSPPSPVLQGTVHGGPSNGMAIHQESYFNSAARDTIEMPNNFPRPGAFPDTSSSLYFASGLTSQTAGPSSTRHPGTINHALPYAVPNHLHLGGGHQAYVPALFPSASNAVVHSSGQVQSGNQIPLAASVSKEYNGKTGATMSRRSREIAKRDCSSLRVDASILLTVPGMSPQEKYEVKRLRNQLSGARSRQRKRDKEEKLSKQVNHLKEKNTKLKTKWIELRNRTKQKISEIVEDADHPQAELRLIIATNIQNLATRVLARE